MTDQPIEPQVGMRFILHGADFEVTFVAHGVVRYAASAGGRQYRLPLSDFIDLARQKVVLVTADSARLTITANNGKVLARRHRYVEAVLRQLPHPTANAPLNALVKQVAAVIGDPSPPTARCVIYWLRAYQRYEVAGLIRKRHSGNWTLRFDPQIEQLIAEGIQQIYLKPERCNAMDVRSYVVGRLAELGLCTAHHADIRIPSLRSIQRRLKQLDPYVVARAQRGDFAANRVARAAGRSIRAGEILSLVEMDTHYMDVLIVDPDTGEVLVRPFLTCVLDVCTRAVVGIYISLYPPSAATALAALKDMLTRFGRGLPGGVPIIIIPDNGVEFKNTAFARLCETFAITISPAQIRDPNGKAHIESFFRTLTYGIVQKLAGTTFSNPKKKGDYDSVKNACFTLAQLRQFTEEWINESYHTAIHSQTGRAPILAWEDQAQQAPPLSLTDEEVNALARRPVTRTIQHGRVQVDGIEYFSHALATLQAQGETRVTVLVDDLDLHTVLIQHPVEKDTLIVGESTDPEYTVGLTCYAHEEAMKIKKEMSRADLQRLGPQANLLARWRLLEKIHKESQVAKRWIRKLTNGEGRKTHSAQNQIQIQHAASGSDIDPCLIVLDDVSVLSPELSNLADPSADAGTPITAQHFESFELGWINDSK